MRSFLSLFSKPSLIPLATLAVTPVVLGILWPGRQFLDPWKVASGPSLLLAVAALAAVAVLRARFAETWHEGTRRQTVRGERSRFEEGIVASDEAIVGITPEGIVTSWNAAAEQISGYTAREIVGQHVSILAAPETRAAQAAWFAQACRGARVCPYEMTPAAWEGSEASLCFDPVSLS